MSKIWKQGDELTADNLNRTGGVGDIISPETDGSPTTAAQVNAIIATVAAEGGGTVLFKAGDYTFDDDIALSDYVSIEGESYGSVSFDFDSNSKGVLIQGSGGYEVGTISITKGATTVTGSSTNWTTNASAGQKIWIRGFWYTISSITSDTELELGSTYSGRTVSGVSYAIATPAEGIRIQNISITGSFGSALKYEYTTNTILEGVTIESSNIALETNYVTSHITENLDILLCTKGIVADHAASQTISNYLIAGTTNESIRYENSTAVKLFAGYCSSAGTDGIYFKDCDGIAFTTIAENNGGNGIVLENCEEFTLHDANAMTNTSSGIKLINSNKNSLNLCFLANNGTYGLEIDSDSEDNIVNGCYFEGNTTDEVDNDGTDTVISGCSPSSVNTIKEIDIQTFTADGTWTKPAGAKTVDVVLIGAGGGGGGGGCGGKRTSGTGGGGGAYHRKTFNASDLGDTETVTIGEGGAGGAGSDSSTSGDDGSVGGNTTFGTHLTSFGGGGGGGERDEGGGGGGTVSAGNEEVGGNPKILETDINAIGGGGANSQNSNQGNPGNAEYGGGAGGGSHHDSPYSKPGGSSLYGGGGGGAGGEGNDSGEEGGTTNSYTVGGGGAINGGNGGYLEGGGGGKGDDDGTGGNGGTGGVGGGGGGGGTGEEEEGKGGGDGGSGGRGEAIITTYF